MSRQLANQTDFNQVVLVGTLTAASETTVFENGTRATRFLVTVTSEEPRRIDVIPVTVWDDGSSDEFDLLTGIEPGTRLRVEGTLQRRFWQDTSSRSRIEVVARHVRTIKQEQR